MRSFKVVLTIVCSLFLFSALTSVSSAAKKKKTTPKVKLYTMKTATTKVPTPSQKKSVLQPSQLINARCKSGYLPLSIGISKAMSPMAAQDIGWGGMSVYVDGVGGTARNQLQALCVKGGRIPSYIGKAVKLSSSGSGLALTATLKCKKGTVALGAGLAHGHAPAIGHYRSMPTGARTWSYSAAIDQYNAGIYKGRYSQLGYPRAACVRATSVNQVDFKGILTAEAPTTEKLTCKKGRALGWGVELMPFRRYSGNDGSWYTPIIEQAKFSGKNAIKFTFTRGGLSGYSTPTAVNAALICGKLPKG